MNQTKEIKILPEQEWLDLFDATTFKKTRDNYTNHAMWLGWLACLKELGVVADIDGKSP